MRSLNSYPLLQFVLQKHENPGVMPAYKPIGPGLQIFGLITLPLVINYALLGWAKKLKGSKCWWGRCVLVMCEKIRKCGNESQPCRWNLKWFHKSNSAQRPDDTSDLAFNPSDDSDQYAAIAAMEACLCDIRRCMINDKLMINDSKTEFMLTGTKAQLQKIKSATLTIGESIISPTTESLSLQPQMK